MPRTILATDGYRDLVEYDEESIRVENTDLGVCSGWLDMGQVAQILAMHYRGEAMDWPLDETLDPEPSSYN